MSGTDDEVRENGRRPDPRVAGLTPEFVDEVRDALDRDQPERVRALVTPLGYADLADLLEPLDSRERAALIQAIRDSFDPTVLTELDDSVRLDVVEQFSTADLAAAIAKLESDDALYLIETLDDERRIAVMQAMPAAFRAILEQGLSYPESSAGRLMQRDVVAVPGFWTVGETIDFLRRSHGLPDDFYDLFVVDPAHRPAGTVPTSRVLRNPRETRIRDIMDDRGLSVPATMDQEQVADIFRRNDLVTVPVVDDAQRLIGAITVDDIVDVIDEEAEEDMLGLARTGERDIFASPAADGAAAPELASGHAGQHDPGVAGDLPVRRRHRGDRGAGDPDADRRRHGRQCRDAGGHRHGPCAGGPRPDGRRTWRVIGKEIVVGLMNGVVFATVMGTIATLWFGDGALGAVLASAMMFNMVWAGLAGTLIPLTLNRFGVDPAVAAGPFLTTTTDVLGFFVFLGLASVFLL